MSEAEGGITYTRSLLSYVELLLQRDGGGAPV